MSTVAPSFVNLLQLLGLEESAWDMMFWQKACEMRVAIPAVVTAVRTGPLSVDVQPAIQENVFKNLVPTPTNLPVLPQVPVLLYGAGNFVITVPITVGDECMVIFQDMCINRWRVQGAPSSGPVANQEERRRHDLSDGIAVFGLWSQPRDVANYNLSALEIRSLNDRTVVQLLPGQLIGTADGFVTTINITPGQVILSPDSGATAVVVKPGEIDLNATSVKINGTNFHSHEHSGVTTGGGVTGPVFP